MIAIEVRSLGAFRSWLFGMGDHAVVLDPPALVDEITSWLSAILGAE